MADRYTVREVRGMGLGAGGFEVVDTQQGSTFGLTIWRDEAEKLAARHNAQDRAKRRACEHGCNGCDDCTDYNADDDGVKATHSAHRLLGAGDVLQAGDEVVSDCGTSWRSVPAWSFGLEYAPGTFKVTRRALGVASPAEPQGD